MTNATNVEELTQDAAVSYYGESDTVQTISVKRNTVPMAKIAKVEGLLRDLSRRLSIKLENMFGGSIIEPHHLVFLCNDKHGAEKTLVIAYHPQIRSLYVNERRVIGGENFPVEPEQLPTIEAFVSAIHSGEFTEDAIDAAIAELERQMKLWELYAMIPPLRKYLILWRQIYGDYGKGLNITNDVWAEVPKGLLIHNRSGEITAVAFHEYLRRHVLTEVVRQTPAGVQPCPHVHAIGDNLKERDGWIPCLDNCDLTATTSAIKTLINSYDRIVKALPPRPTKPLVSPADRRLIEEAADFIKMLYKVKTHLSEDNEKVELLASKLIAVRNEMGMSTERETIRNSFNPNRPVTASRLANKPPLFRVPVEPMK